MLSVFDFFTTSNSRIYYFSMIYKIDIYHDKDNYENFDIVVDGEITDSLISKVANALSYSPYFFGPFLSNIFFHSKKSILTEKYKQKLINDGFPYNISSSLHMPKFSISAQVESFTWFSWWQWDVYEVNKVNFVPLTYTVVQRFTDYVDVEVSNVSMVFSLYGSRTYSYWSERKCYQENIDCPSSFKFRLFKSSGVSSCCENSLNFNPILKLLGG